MQDRDASTNEDNDDKCGIGSGDVILSTVGNPSYSWGTAKHLSLPIILDPLFKQTQDTIKKFARQLPVLNNQLARALATLDRDPAYSILLRSNPLTAQRG